MSSRTRKDGRAHVKLLVLSPALPSPTWSAESRWLYMALAGLVSRGHEVACLSCAAAAPSDVEAARELVEREGIRFAFEPFELHEGLVRRKLSSLRQPYSEFSRLPHLPRRMADLMPDPDVIHVEQLGTSSSLGTDDPGLVFVHNVDHVDWAGSGVNLRSRVRLSQMQRASRLHIGARRHYAANSERVADLLRAHGATNVGVVPLSIDYCLYPPVPERTPGPPRVGLIGSMHHRPSRLAAERLITRLAPALTRALPEVQVAVAGWRADFFLKHLVPGPNVEILTSVPDAAAFVRGLDVLLYAPPHGTGVKVKVLESLAWGVPVVTNRNGREGLEDLSPSALPCAESDEELVALTLELLSSGQCHRAGLLARRELLQKYPNDRSLEALERRYETVIAGESTRA
jgi:glycosyltransferase involved in cell wall biosynthesis